MAKGTVIFIKKRQLCVLIFLCFAVRFCTGCGGASGLKTITLNEAAHSVFYAPLYVAMEKGYLKDAGIKIKLVNGMGSDHTMAALRGGDCDIALMGPENVIYAYKEGAEDSVISFAQITQRAGDFLVSKVLNEDFNWDKLKGKTVIGGRKDGMPQMVFEYILKKHGINPAADLTMITDIEFGLTAQAFASNKGDYTIEFEPTATAQEQSGAGKLVAALGLESGKVPYTVFSAKKSYLEKAPYMIQGFTAALQKGLDYVASHTPEEVAKVIEPQFSQTDREVLTKILKNYYEQDTWKADLKFEKGSFILLEDIMKEAGQLDKSIPYEEIVTTEYAEKVSNKK